ncbi:MAG: DUF5694 domain-containing protein [Candidatus Omnitrophota bacterium]
MNNNSEIAVIAIGHFITDMPEGYTPAHLRALLKKIAPDILAVEVPTNIENAWQYAPLDLWQVTKPWADSENIEVIPVGWFDMDFQFKLSDMFKEFQEKGNLEDYQKVEMDFQTLSASKKYTIEYTNSDEAHNVWRQYHFNLQSLYGKRTAWQDWNDNIVRNINDLCEKNKNKRIAVIFGSAHCYYFVDLLKDIPNIKLLDTASYFPLEAAAVAGYTYPVDYLKALRLLNFNAGTLNPAVLIQLESKLNKLKAFPGLINDYNLFLGKFYLHKYRFDEALAAFGKVSKLDKNVISEFDGQTPLRETGHVYTALCRIQMGDYAAAREVLEKVLYEEDITQYTRQWAQQLLNTLP